MHQANKLELRVNKTYEDMLTKRDVWRSNWQYVGKYVDTFKQNIEDTVDYTQGAELNDQVFDATAIRAASQLGSALVDLLWFSNGKNILIDPPEWMFELSEEEKVWYETVDLILNHAFNNPKARFGVALSEYMQDQVSIGTSGIYVRRGIESKLIFSAHSIEQTLIEQDQNGVVDKIGIIRHLRVLDLIDEYGIENVSEEVAKMYNEEKFSEEISVLQLIEPRNNSTAESYKQFPFISYHQEILSKKIVKTSGFYDLPIKIGRFYKRPNESYGRSPSMKSMPDIRQMNQLCYQISTARELLLFPPLGIYGDSLQGKASLNTIPGSINTFIRRSRINSDKPVFAIDTIGNPIEAYKEKLELKDSIQKNFLLDNFMSQEDNKERTAYEVRVDTKKQAASLGAIITRQVTELFSPVVELAFSILYEDNEFPEAPARIKSLIENWEDFYIVKFVNPALRIQRFEEAQGIKETAQFAAEMSNVNPGPLFDVINMDRSIKHISSIYGAPPNIINSDEEFARKRKARELMEEKARMAENLNKAGTAIQSLGAMGGR